MLKHDATTHSFNMSLLETVHTGHATPELYSISIWQ